MLNNLPIYTIGDSHSRFSFEYNLNENTRHPRITNSFWLGPITMHRVGRDSISFNTHLVPTNGIVVVLVKLMYEIIYNLFFYYKILMDILYYILHYINN